jgi:integrase
MPPKQQGEVFKRGKVWQARWLDHDGNRKSKSGFATRTDGRAFLNAELDRIASVKAGKLAPDAERHGTLDDLLDDFLTRHGATIDPATKQKLTTQLKHARSTFGTRSPDTLRRLELEDWRASLPAGSRHDVFRALRQALTWGAGRGLLDRDATEGIKNPKRPRDQRKDVHPFETWDEVDAIADELDKRYRAIPILLVGTGLRPEEAFGLHRSDVDRDAKVLHVQRRYSGGIVKAGGKTPGSVRVVPLRQRVLDALDGLPPRIDTPILFPAPRGGYIDLEKFRHREWTPALRAAGLDHRRIYDCRHTFATWAIEDGIALWHLAVVMGTSVVQIEDTYARWLKRTDDQLRAAFDAYDLKEVANG